MAPSDTCRPLSAQPRRWSRLLYSDMNVLVADRVRGVSIWDVFVASMTSSPITAIVNVLGILTGAQVVAVALVALVRVLVRGIRRLVARIPVTVVRKKDLRELAEPPKASEPAWVPPPRWALRKPDKEQLKKLGDLSNVYGLKNAGGDAKHVQLRAEDDLVEIIGVADWETFPAGGIQPFSVPKLTMGGIIETWFVVSSKDANGRPVADQRVHIPGALT